MSNNKVSHAAMMCEHANEVPKVCPCHADCYCRMHTCKTNEGFTQAELHQLRKEIRAGIKEALASLFEGNKKK